MRITHTLTTNRVDTASQIALAVLFMDYKCRIESIISRAGRIALALQDLCATAGISKSTLYRWQQDDANPQLRKMRLALDAMEAELGRREAALVQELTKGDEAA
jgi:transcriptional regulator with XRE-family HTH domain